MRRAALAALLVCLAAPPAAGDERVPLESNFPRGEQIAIGGTAVSLGLLFVFQDALVDLRGSPAIGDPLGFDHAVSDALYRPGAGKLWYGVPDKTGIAVAPALSGAFYLGEAIVQWSRGTSVTGDKNADHELLAFAEAYGVTMGLTQLVKVSVGRERPFVALDRPEHPERDTDSGLSFFSGHSSSSFCIAAFVHRDVSDALVSGPLAGSGAGTRFWAGRVAPGVVLYGAAALIAYSRVVDQKHFLTDVLLGSLVGGLTANLVYARHFDGDGRPRGGGVATGAALTPAPLGLSFGGVF